MRVGIIYGGRSGEHEVSIESARSVLAAIDPILYDVLPIGVTQEGAWHVVEPTALLEGRLDEGPRLLASADPARQVLSVPARSELQTTALTSGLSPEERGLGLDVAFPLIHGTFGEDGCIQGLLELAGIPYVGAGVLGSAVGMDKIVMKSVFVAEGIPVAPYMGVTRADWEHRPKAVAGQLAERIGYPCFVKPANLGSSVGISRVANAGRLGAAMDSAAEFAARIIVEGAVDARELECGVLGNDAPEASVVGEVLIARDFYDYEAKYHDQRTRFAIPAEVPNRIADEVRQLAVRAFRAVGASGMARVDFFLDRKGDALYLNELNTIPGFTTMSAYPRLWEASGVPYPELINRLIRLAFGRHADQARNRTRYGGGEPPLAKG